MSKVKNRVGLIKCEDEEQKNILNRLQDDFRWFSILEILEHTTFIKNALHELKEHDDNAITADYLEKICFFLDIVNKAMVSFYYLLRPFK